MQVISLPANSLNSLPFWAHCLGAEPLPKLDTNFSSPQRRSRDPDRWQGWEKVHHITQDSARKSSRKLGQSHQNSLTDTTMSCGFHSGCTLESPEEVLKL